jgi:hypothetical protein
MNVNKKQAEATRGRVLIMAIKRKMVYGIQKWQVGDICGGDRQISEQIRIANCQVYEMISNHELSAIYRQ